MTGDDVEIDSRIADKLSIVLMHVLRNAVDHGIERDRSGKPAKGTITVACYRDSDMLHLSVRDDGQGVDLTRVRSLAAARKLADAATSDEALIELLFTPGFSTAAAITAISGRGVGLDVVRAAVRDLGGTVHMRSDRHVGTSVEVVIPLTPYEVV